MAKIWLAFCVVLAGAIYFSRDNLGIGEAIILRCYDGDTCRARFQNRVYLNVRLAGIDSPEIGRKGKASEPFADEARKKANELLRGAKVEIQQIDLDHYNRPIVVIFLNNENINKRMLRLGLAEVYKGASYRLVLSEYRTEMAAAQRAKRGMWQDKK